ncbi:MAG: GGDEF domain-containing protein [Lachnospiraceae bacterium]|jgi:diguanylate cyclase (GGDEF)-like protein|nr:GGDEF domain-containing protein [Lachnospiraceae bacterium]
MTENKKKLINRIVGFIMVVLSIIVFISFFETMRISRYEDDSVTVTGEYDVTFNGKVYDDVDISTYKFPSIKKGDHVTYSFVMPETHVEDAVLTLYLDHAAVKVFYDDELVYEKGNPNSRMLGYGYVNVNLPDDYAGMNVRVEIDAIENEGLSSLSQPVINNVRVKFHNYLVDNSFYLIVDIAIITLCITIVLLSFIFTRIMPALKHLAYFGMAFFMMGLYEYCSYNLIWIFSDSLVMRGYMEYLTLYSGPFFLTLYFYKEFFERESARTKKLYKVILILQAAFPIVALILHFTDIAHLPELLTPFHILLFVNVLTVLILLVRSMLRKNNTHKHMVIGLIILIVLAIIDMLRFNLYMHFMLNRMRNYVSYLLFGFFLFLVAMIIDFFVNQRTKIYKAAHAEAMAKLANVDMMTNLANRRGCENAFDELRRDDKVFGIICIDLNYLKLTNDKYGHQEGDKLLVDFANVLSSACNNDTYTVGRMGGDEFTVIIPQADKSIIEATVESINKKCEEVNAARKPLPISFAYGYCMSDDEKVTSVADESDMVERVYHVADARMYKHKTDMKAGR